ncbi:unnamed protein product [Thelazia callipaeda]|uniref:PDZ domain-containing protein n=1 Tax=Thelazia callipaeda TaxID=103827 RepID=A0A0N5DAB8_THECL|nr:unnamed protein product [Thelazia callipaeda]
MPCSLLCLIRVVLWLEKWHFELKSVNPYPQEGLSSSYRERSRQSESGRLHPLTACTRAIRVNPYPVQALENKVPVKPTGPFAESCYREDNKGENDSNGERLMTRHLIPPLLEEGHNFKLQVQLAHGSAIRIVSGFLNIKQLYELIARNYDQVKVDDILFCTVNTHRIRMDALMSYNIFNDDCIFAHIAGQKKEVTLVKTSPKLGLTIADNGIGKAFIKRIVPGALTFEKNPFLRVGDCIEKINNLSMVGRRHFDVVHYLQLLPIGLTFTMQVVEPRHIRFSVSFCGNPPLILRKRRTAIRFKSDGRVVMLPEPLNETIINKINDVIDLYFCLHDDDIANTIWQLAASSTNFPRFCNALKKSHVGILNFPENIFTDIWRIRNAYKKGYLLRDEADEEYAITDLPSTSGRDTLLTSSKNIKTWWN